MSLKEKSKARDARVWELALWVYLLKDSPAEGSLQRANTEQSGTSAGPAALCTRQMPGGISCDCALHQPGKEKGWAASRPRV